MKKAKPEKTNPSNKVELVQDSDREAVLSEREKLQRLYPLRYSADIGVWTGDRVEVMLKLTYAQAANLARLLHANKL